MQFLDQGQHICRASYSRATEELTAILRQAYSQYAGKAVQELVYEDILLAVRRCSRHVHCKPNPPDTGARLCDLPVFIHTLQLNSQVSLQA